MGLLARNHIRPVGLHSTSIRPWSTVLKLTTNIIYTADCARQFIHKNGVKSWLSDVLNTNIYIAYLIITLIMSLLNKTYLCDNISVLLEIAKGPYCYKRKIRRIYVRVRKTNLNSGGFSLGCQKKYRGFIKPSTKPPRKTLKQTTASLLNLSSSFKATIYSYP